MAIAVLETRLAQFKATLDADVKSLMRLYAAESAGVGRPGEWMDAITRSAVVLLAATFENFVEELVCDSLTHLASIPVMARKYPQRFRHWLFHEEVNMRNIGIDSSKDYIDLSLRLYSDVRPLTLSELKLDRLKEEFANPTAKNVNWLVSLYDVDNYLDGVAITVDKVETSAKSAIGELSTRRNDIAHGDVSQKPTDEDVNRLTKFCQLFSNRFAKDITAVTQQSLK